MTSSITRFSKSDDKSECNDLYILSRSITVEKGELSILSFSPDNTQIAYGGFGCRAILLDLSTEREIISFDFGSRSNITSLSFSPDSRKLAVGSDGEAIILDIIHKTKLQDFYRENNSFIESIVFSHDSKEIALGLTPNPYGREKFSILKSKRKFFQCYSVRADIVTFSHKSNHLLFGRTKDKKVILYNISDEKIVHTFETNGWVRATAISMDDTKLAITGTDKKVTIHDFISGDLLHTFLSKTWIYSIAFSPDGNKIIVGESGGSVIIWNLITGTKLQSFKAESQVYSVAFSADGRNIAFNGGVSQLQIHTMQKWYIIKDFILLRKLVQNDRAFTILSRSKANLVIQKLITFPNEDVFIAVLSFL